MSEKKNDPQPRSGSKPAKGKPRAVPFTQGVFAGPVVRPEEREEYDELVSGLRQDFNPKGPIEAGLVEKLTEAAWNMRRAGAMESELADTAGMDPLLSSDPAIWKQLNEIMRFRTMSHKLFDKVYKELKTTQRLRAQREVMEARRPAPPPPPVPPAAKAILPKPGGFGPYRKLMLEIEDEEQAARVSIRDASSVLANIKEMLRK